MKLTLRVYPFLFLLFLLLVTPLLIISTLPGIVIIVDIKIINLKLSCSTKKFLRRTICDLPQIKSKWSVLIPKTFNSRKQAFEQNQKVCEFSKHVLTFYTYGVIRTSHYECLELRKPTRNKLSNLFIIGLDAIFVLIDRSFVRSTWPNQLDRWIIWNFNRWGSKLYRS